ncbi:MAG TPA: long-chain fatty acid--CoA ligase [Paenibacillus sp.]|nr:long-chain fatty acid--CoA ligase [Paenibacillus sp.]
MDATKPWLAHYPPEVPSTRRYPKQNVAKFLLDAAERYPTRPAVDFLGAKMTYAHLRESAFRFANAIRALGVEKGDRVAIMLPNCPAAVTAYFGTLLAGAVVVQTNPLYQPHELKHQLGDSGAALIVTLDQLYARVEAALPYTQIRCVLVTSIAENLPWPKSWLYPLKLKKQKQYVKMNYTPDVRSFRAELASASPAPTLAEVDAEEDLAALQYTGGTTGVAKGVMLTHYNLVANTIQNSLWNYKGKPGEEKFLAALPLFHVFGLTVIMNQAALLAAELVLLPRFEAETVLKTIQKKRPTIFPGAPTMYIALINHPRIREYDLSSVEVCVSGASSLPLEVQEKFEALSGARLIEGYGMTEASPVTHANPIWGLRKIGTVGVPFPDTEAKIVDGETGEEKPAGEIGEIIVRGPQVMKGYWKRPIETANTLKDGWLYTGDMGRMDEDGFFAIVDRKKDLIIASGFNVYPREVEEALFEHPAVKEAVVAGVPDAYRGETVKAYVVLKDGADVTASALEAHCRDLLAAYKVPRLFEFRDELPKTLIGKPLRRALLEEEAARREKETDA